MSQEKLDLLLEAIGSLRSIAERCSVVRIQITNDPAVDSFATSTLKPRSGGIENEWEAVGRLPEAVADVWQHVLKFVVSWLEQRELFLRTGYRSGETSAAIDALVVRGAHA